MPDFQEEVLQKLQTESMWDRDSPSLRIDLRSMRKQSKSGKGFGQK